MVIIGEKPFSFIVYPFQAGATKVKGGCLEILLGIVEK